MATIRGEIKSLNTKRVPEKEEGVIVGSHLELQIGLASLETDQEEYLGEMMGKRVVISITEEQGRLPQ